MAGLVKLPGAAGLPPSRSHPSAAPHPHPVLPQSWSPGPSTPPSAFGSHTLLLIPHQPQPCPGCPEIDLCPEGEVTEKELSLESKHQMGSLDCVSEARILSLLCHSPHPCTHLHPAVQDRGWWACQADKGQGQGSGGVLGILTLEGAISALERLQPWIFKVVITTG